MRVKLYKDIKADNLYTFSEVKQEYESHNCEIPVDDDTMIQIINENVWSVGGNVLIICDNDSVLAWCNDYADYMQAEKYLKTEEIENSVRDIYYAILDKDMQIIKAIKDNLSECDELLNRLNILFELLE